MPQKKQTLDEKRKLLFLLLERKERGLEIPKLNDYSIVSSDWGVDENGYFIRDDGMHYEPSGQHTLFIDSKARFSAFFGPRGSGKCLSINTEVPTILGWNTIEGIEIGDWVFDEQGNPTRVIDVSPIMYDHQCYEITFIDETKVIADSEHKWVVMNEKDRVSQSKFGTGTPTLMTTIEMFKDQVIRYKGINYYKNAINVCQPVNYCSMYLPIHPYALGVWLGDGNSRDAKITVHNDDMQIIDKLIELGYNLKKLPEYCAWSLGDDGFENKKNFQVLLRKLHVWQNKHIPEIYLIGDVNQRMELIRGLMDTDGCVSKKGTCCFDNKNEKLVDGFRELLSSFGIRSTKKLYKIQTPSKNDCGYSYKVSFTTDLPVCSLQRKLERIKKVITIRQTRRTIKSIIPIDSVPVKCLVVDSPSHQFLVTRNYIPTHNSASGAQKALKKVMTGENGAIMNADMENFKFSTWPEFRRWIPWNMIVPRQRYRQSPAWDATRPFTLVFVNGARIVCKGLKDPDSARGPNINWLWYDEAGRDKTGMGWKLAVAGVRVGNNPQAWATYTPKDFYHWSYDFFIKQTISEEMKQLIKEMPEGYKLIEWFHGTRKDNEKHLDALFYASLESAYPGGYLRTQEVEGDYANEGGSLGTRAWFNDHILDKEPEWAYKKVRYWDLAATEKKLGKDKNDPDETIGTLLSTDEKKENFCIENQVGGWWVWDKIKENIRTIARMDGTGVAIWIEQEPASGGKNQVAEITNFLKDEGFQVKGHNPKDDGDRVMAANTWYGEASQGKWWIVKGLWNDKFFIQLDTFPDENVHDDRITSCSGARHVIAPIRKWRKVAFKAIGMPEKKPDSPLIIQVDK